MDPVRVELDDKVLRDSRPVVIGFLLVQVVRSAGEGDFDDEFRCTSEIPIRVHDASATKLGRDEQEVIWLRLTLTIQLYRRTIGALNTWSSVSILE